MGKKHKFIFLILIVAFLVFAFSYWCFNKNIYLDFNLVKSFDVDRQLIDESDFDWVSLISEEYEPMWNIDYVENKYNVGKEISSIIDVDKYSYIVTFGRELKSVSYNWNDARTRYLGLIPKQKTAKVVLSKNKISRVYVYKIKKCNIVNDYYGNGFDMVLYE